MTWMNLNDEGSDAGNNADDAAGAAANGGEDNKATKPSDLEAKLLKEVMEKKEALNKAKTDAVAAIEAKADLERRLAAFDGVNLEEVKALLKDRQDRELSELEKKGEFDRVKKQMQEAQAAELAKIATERDTIKATLEEQVTKATRQITELTIGRSFSESPFIRESMTLTPAKTRIVYGQHFELQNGNVVAYDKPVGETDRTVLVDANGNPLGFDAAMAKLVETDPDRDNLLRSKMRSGAGSENDSDARNGKKEVVMTSKERIRAGLNGLKLPNAQ